MNKRPPPPYQSRLPRAEDLIKQAGTSPSPSGKHPDQATTSLSSRGELIKQQIEESDPRFISKKMRHPDSFAASLLELCPGLHTTDLVLLTGVQYDTAALLRALRKVPLTEAGERLKQRLSSPDWNPYQPLAGEDSLKWAIRVSDMDYQLEPEDIVKIRPCCIKSLRKHQLRRPPLSANAQQVMEALNSAFPEKFARRQDEGWKEWFDRLAQHEPRLTHNELVTLTGFYPDVEHQYPFNIIQPPASRSPSAVQSATRVSKKALSPPSSTLHEAEYARSQAVSLAVQDQILRTKGLIRVANNSDTRTAYRNCLLIALLQHATKDYTQSPVLCQLVNNYRQWLVSQGWQGHASGFGPDGYMAFGHQGETTQGAAAALLEMINSNLMKGDLPPLRVINYSFAAGMEFEEILGSQAPDARVVHIVNTGQHFEALIAAPADNQT
ncbi:hypothetical protein [Erwinia sp. V71]|uniref:hypothetical protein n=1 Tax=Erwinia sp. V71 TaxID=3369424 RepID=UPI003F63A03A